MYVWTYSVGLYDCIFKYEVIIYSIRYIYTYYYIASMNTSLHSTVITQQ
jgi:hypothetical protein